MSYIFYSSLFFAFTAPLFWAVVFFLNRKKSVSAAYGFWLFLSGAVVFLLCLANNSRWIELSLLTYLFYPIAILSMPVLLMFFEYSLAHNNQPVPPRFYLFLLAPVIQWLVSDYIHYVHYSYEFLTVNYYSMFHIPVRQLPDELRHGGICKLITHGVTVIEVCILIVMVMVWIPVFIQNSFQKKSGNIKNTKGNYIFLSALTLVIAIIGILQITSVFISSVIWVTILEYLWGTIMLVCGFYLFRETGKQKETTQELSFMPNSPRSSLIELLKRHFEEDKPYLNPDLKISDVARAIKTNRTYLSDLLSSDLDVNFNRFVNKYRIETALNILQNPGEKKLLEVAELSGFNSYSVFFCAFKEETGLSPAGYLAMKNSL